jgi:hypothetical protein
MRSSFLIWIVLFFSIYASAQSSESQLAQFPALAGVELPALSEDVATQRLKDFKIVEIAKNFEKACIDPAEIDWGSTKKTAEDDDDIPTPKTKDKFHWKPALIQSGIMLGVQHGFRMTQVGAKRELRGPFFRDWGKSVKNLRGWHDGDGFVINYVAHSLQGATTGRIFINNSDKAKRQEFGKSKQYWESRFKAMAWSAVWSTQFELGPISEASIGNLGMYNDSGRSRMAWKDLVVTPVLGTGVAIGEDAIDKYILKKWLEKRSNNKLTKKIKILRSFLTPTTSVANLLRGKVPWKRDNRR